MMQFNLDNGDLQVQSPDWDFFSSSSSPSSDHHSDINSMLASPARNPIFQQTLSSNHIEKPQTPGFRWVVSDKPSEDSQQDMINVEFLNFDYDKNENQQVELMRQDQLMGKSQAFAAEGTSFQGQRSIGNDQMYLEMNGTGQDVLFLRDTLPLEQEQQQQQELNLQGLTNELPLSELQQQMYLHQNIMPPQLSNSHPVQEEEESLQLVQLLLICGEAAAKQDFKLANKYLQLLKSMTSPLGNPMQRVAAWFMEALNTLLNKPPSPAAATATCNPITRLMSTLPPEPTEILKIYRVFYQTCPYIKFAHFTCNQTILEAFQGEDKVHIIDLHIIQGFQWVSLMEALARRHGGPPSLKITGIGMLIGCVRETGRRLTELARFLHIPFEFHAIGSGLHELKPHMFTRKIGEALAVNCVGCLHLVPSDTLGKLVLTMIRNQAPNAVTIVEPEANHDGPHFFGRFLEALHYYSAIFDSLNATFPPEQSVDRWKVEKYMFAPEIQDIVAYEEKERGVRHQRLHRWRKLMEAKGFKGLPFSPNAMSQAVTLLEMYSCDDYWLTEEKGCLILGWQDRALLAASAWRC